MSAGQNTTYKVTLGLIAGVVAGLGFFWLTEKFPNIGVLFLTSTVPVYLSWKIPFPSPLWLWFTIYYTGVGASMGLLAARQHRVKGCLVFLAVLIAIHYLVTFLIAGEISRIPL